MPLDQEKLDALDLIAKPAVCEFLAVYWSADDADTRYYAVNKFDEINPFRGVKNHLAAGAEIEVRLKGAPFHAFQIHGDLQTETINFTFDNIDGEIKTLFQEFGEGVKCELFYYYPQVDLLVGAWWGVLSKPSNADYQMLSVEAKNGFFSSESLLPGRMRTNSCSFTFGGEIQTLEDLETNGCPYNKHLGGTIGKLNSGVPFEHCPRLSTADCVARIDQDASKVPFWGGFRWNVPLAVTDPRGGAAVPTKGVGSTLTQPIRVIAGTVQLENLPQLFFRPEVTTNDVEKSWVRAVFEVGERVQRSYNLKTGTAGIGAIHQDTRPGHRGQTGIGFGAGASIIPAFSALSHVSAAYGHINPKNFQTANSFPLSATVIGYDQVKVYTDEDTYTRVYSTNRIWWILELYTNQTFGLKYAHSRFNLTDFLSASAWSLNTIRFVYNNPEGTDSNFDHQRTTFNAILDGRSATEQITDICRAGRVSVPFQHEGKYTIQPLKKLSSEELEAVKVFTDFGDNRNIVWKEGYPSINVSEQSDRDLANEIVCTFLDSANKWQARPLTVDDPNQKRKAGRAVNENGLHTVKKHYQAFGITKEAESLHFAYSLLWFGEFDEGGIKNNLRVNFTAWFEQTLDLKKYDVIKIDSNLIAGYGYTDPFTDVFTQFEYFRIVDMRKGADNLVEIAAQAYNQDAYDEYETFISIDPPPPPPPPDPTGNPCIPSIASVTYEEGVLTLLPEPC